MWSMQFILSGISDIWLIAFAFYITPPTPGSIEEYIYFIINAAAFMWQASVLGGVGYNAQGFLNEWWVAIGRGDMGLLNTITLVATGLIGMFPPMFYVLFEGHNLGLF